MRPLFSRGPVHTFQAHLFRRTEAAAVPADIEIHEERTALPPSLPGDTRVEPVTAPPEETETAPPSSGYGQQPSSPGPPHASLPPAVMEATAQVTTTTSRQPGPGEAPPARAVAAEENPTRRKPLTKSKSLQSAAGRSRSIVQSPPAEQEETTSAAVSPAAAAAGTVFQSGEPAREYGEGDAVTALSAPAYGAAPVTTSVSREAMAAAVQNLVPMGEPGYADAPPVLINTEQETPDGFQTRSAAGNTAIVRDRSAKRGTVSEVFPAPAVKPAVSARLPAPVKNQVEVKIGKIDLEVHRAAPAAPKTVIRQQAASPGGNNLSRYYLRGW